MIEETFGRVVVNNGLLAGLALLRVANPGSPAVMPCESRVMLKCTSSACKVVGAGNQHVATTSVQLKCSRSEWQHGAMRCRGFVKHAR